MTNNGTSAKVTEGFIGLVGYNVLSYIAWSLFVPTFLTLIYGVISWCLIKKFRHFRNYVMLSATLANTIRLFVFALFITLKTKNIVIRNAKVRLIPSSLMLYGALAHHGWLLVLCYIFYVDFVQVFRLDIHRRYLKSSLFAWGVPLVSMSLYYLSGWLLFLYYSREIITIPIAKALLLIPVTMNFIIYVLVLFSLFRSSKTSASTSTNKLRRFYISTMIFVLSNIIVLFYIFELFNIKLLAIDILGEILEYVNTLALDFYMVILKGNRALWGEYLNRRSRQKSQGIKPVQNLHKNNSNSSGTKTTSLSA